ncbi:hypothetical protein GSI_13176 [Ganoderma sinense ZZ0214-1]|uniref:Transporter n=1 Tax=Ganoderma sinense ZZ0214-1 TaxID=1077348 RepID=A0A2G8RUU8_9APHY|nr:hypothetical protein GSI_13176 [Ganoderma sinense ZZ0214-1]
MFSTTLLTFLGAIATLAVATPMKRTVSNGAAINKNFADPGLMLNSNGVWYAYSTTSSSGLVPMSNSTNFKTWTKPTNVLTSVGAWATGAVWDPDVREISSGHYVMYYAARRNGGPSNDHCLGVATATHPNGPFTPKSTPLMCDLASGGLIGITGFKAPDGRLYVVWKVDGNSIKGKTPIKIQRVGANGYDLQGTATTLITNDASSSVDGGLVEAPSLVHWNGWYYLFYSTHNYNTLKYDIRYAVSRSVRGPFSKVGSFLTSGDFSTAGPGSTTVLNIQDKYVNMAFHSDINGKNSSGAGRAMWTISNICLSGGVAKPTC